MTQLKGRKSAHPDMERALNADEKTRPKSRDFQLFSEDEGPQLYHPPKNLVTKPLIPKNLPKVFENLPIYGQPEPGMSLNRFHKNKLKSFLGGISDKHFKELVKMCSVEHLKCGKEVVMHPDIPDQLLMNINAEPYTPQCDTDDDPPLLKILEKNKQRMDEDKEGRFLKKTLKYSNVHLIPLDQQSKTSDATTSIKNVDNIPPVTTTVKKSKKSSKGKKGAKAAKSPGSSKGALTSAKNAESAADDPPAPVNSTPPGEAPADSGPGKTPAATDRNDQLEPGTDILIKIRIYKPFDYEGYKSKPDQSLNNLFHHDLVLTGRHKVSDIKDRFVCSEKKSDSKEASNNGFLFIKNGFYVDKTNEEAADHADSLRQWCALRNFGNFPKYDMNTCQLDQLEYKLGNPDVYIHDTSCEHIIIFSEVRLLDARDPLHMSDYPRITAIAQNIKSAFCYNCAELNPKWIVSGCTRISYNMALFCQQCLKKVLYDEDGKKICKFKAYPVKHLDGMRSH